MKCPHCGRPVAPPWRNPVPTVDIIIEVDGGIVLVRRAHEPLGWALPGGFVDYGESFENTARREAHEETGLEIELIGQLHTYSEPGRDPRMHTATTVFIATASGLPRGGDDAAEARIFSREEIPELVFDHQRILADYFRFKGEGCVQRKDSHR